MASIDTNALQSLLPQAVIQFAMENEAPPPLKQAFKTVALFADVSGFTKLSETFASKGPQGAEELAFVLNRYMEQLVRHIARAGGDVFKFAGDAMLVLWVPDQELDEEGIDNEIQLMAYRAVQTSIAIQNELDSAELAKDITLSVKIGIGVGNATVLHVGGVYSRVEYFACGIPLMQAFKSEEKAKSGDIIISPDVWKIVQDSFEGVTVADKFVRIIRQIKAIRNKSVKFSSKKKTNNWQSNDFQKLLEKYIPAAVLPYLTRCQNSWSGELRLVSVLFVNVGVNLSNVQNIDTTSLEWIQSVITGIQRSIYKYEGSLNKFLVDDKGSNVIAVFGVPPLAHNDDAPRALLAALKLLRKMKGLGIKCYIGVTSGLVYTGLLGSGTSREYGVLGDAVNLAARLMAKQKSSGQTGVICDTPTQELIPSSAPIRFDSLESFHVKGKTQIIKAFQPKYTENYFAYKPQAHYYDIGRTEMIKHVENTFINESSFVLLTESSIGTGKTFFLESIVNLVRSKKANARIIWASGHNYIHSSSHAIWSLILGTLLQKNNYTDNRSYRQHVKSLFAAEPSGVPLISYLSLANDVFGTQFLETEKCSNLQEEHRWDKKTECCLYILEQFSSKNRKLIIFMDNLQWSAKDDWMITEFVVNMASNPSTNNLNNVYVFLATRPILSLLYKPRFEEPPIQYRRIRDKLKDKKHLISLPKWDLLQVTQFLTEYFAVDDVHPCLSHFVYERSGGTPAFVQWIAELIDVHVTHCESVMLLEMSDKTEQSITSEAPLQHPVPIKVHSVAMGYIDRLTPSQVLLLKTASTICMGQGSGSTIFDYQSVVDCYPVAEYKKLVASDLIKLSNIGIIKTIGSGSTQINYDFFCALPMFFAHNHQWMYSSIFISAVCEVSICRTTNQKKPTIFTSKLLHFFINRLIFYPFDSDHGVCWTTKHLMPFNDPLRPIRIRRLSKELLCIENDEYIAQIRSKTGIIEDLHDTLDESLSRGTMTEEQEQKATYPSNVSNQLYSFSCGFFRDVIYGLMLLKQRQQLHDNAAKFLENRWRKENEEKNDDNIINSAEESIGSSMHSMESVCLKSDPTHFCQFRSNVLSRHKDLALKDDTLRRMGSFYQTAPQSNLLQSTGHGLADSGSRRLNKITSFYKSMKGKKPHEKHRIATLSPNYRRKSKQNASIFQRIRKSVASAMTGVAPE